MDVRICTPEVTDYGCYGKDGEFTTELLPVSKCRCHRPPTIQCEYDCTIGSRETVYVIQCKKCKVHTGSTSDIEQAISEWNELAGNPAAHYTPMYLVDRKEAKRTRLLKWAKDAIDNFYREPSVAPEVTHAGMKELRNWIDMKIKDIEG